MSESNSTPINRPVLETELKTMKQVDLDDSGFHLQSLLLCCCSPLAAAVETLIKACRFKLSLEIGGHQNPGYSLYVSIARRMGVDFREVVVEPDAKGTQYVWLSDHSTPIQRAWVPDIQSREGDFHVLCPFFFRYHIAELRKHEPDFPSPKIDCLYVLLLWAICFGPRQIPISARVLKDLLAWEKREVLTAHTYIRPVGDEIAMAAEKASALKELAQLYMGFWTGSDAWGLVRGKDSANHPINMEARKRLNISQPHSSSTVARQPLLVNQYVWEIDQLSVITRNVWALDKFDLSEATRARQCLLLRAQGAREEDIQIELGFSTPEEYYKWQVNRFLDTATGRLGDVYKAWLRACEYFELEPNKELLDQIMNPCLKSEKASQTLVSEEGEDSDNTQAEPPGLIHSPDYRSLKLPDGRSFTLTDRQSQVVSLLHDNLIQGTPELSTAFVVEEVYPGASEKRLRRLFGDNPAYDSLIERGSKRGTVRLKNCFQ